MEKHLYWIGSMCIWRKNLIRLCVTRKERVGRIVSLKKKLDNIDREEELKIMILAYVYIVERYDEVKKRVFIIESMK
jgi:hypothetical protein